MPRERCYRCGQDYDSALVTLCARGPAGANHIPAPPIGPDLDRIIAHLVKLSSEGFFGDLTLRFAGGRFTEANVRQVLKPKDLGPQNQ